MNGFNRVFLMGYLGAEPELHTSKQGQTFVRLSVASHHDRKLENGERETKTTWHRVSAFGRTADQCRDYLHKGSPLAIEGYLTRYSYDKESGETATATGIVAQQVHFIGRVRKEARATEAFEPAP